jgi:hypothetical protein
VVLNEDDYKDDRVLKILIKILTNTERHNSREGLRHLYVVFLGTTYLYLSQNEDISV